MSDTILYSFDGTDGANPQSGVILDSAGNLYGTTSSGGANGGGTVFEITTGSLTTLAAFSSTGTGPIGPYAGLVMDSAGDLFGTTSAGGQYGYGTLFEIPAGSTTPTILVSFDGLAGGGSPYGPLTLDSSGNLYGTSYSGGASAFGTVFEYSTTASSFSTLASFTSATGQNPYAGLTADAAGDLFGTTEYGGTNGLGTVFEIAAGSGTITTLYNFTGTDGQYPTGGITLDAAGDIFGTTSAGGTGNGGTVFEIAKSTGQLTTLYSFTGGTDGANPHAGVTLNAAGDIFGTTVNGGANGEGAVYKLTGTSPGAYMESTVYSFAGGTDGANPYGPLTIDSAGDIIGTTEYGGGTNNDGTVFEIPAAACYYPGTLIATPHGPRAVETLAIGDLVLTHNGTSKPIRWIGRNPVSTRFADPTRILPIRIKAGALGGGLPLRDLLLSPDHALFIENVLIQAGALVNGTTIIRETCVPERFTYYHIELDTHALLLAEGQPAESFVDNLHRMAFENWAEHEALYGPAPIEELPLPRAKSYRQVPAAIRERISNRQIPVQAA